MTCCCCCDGGVEHDKLAETRAANIAGATPEPNPVAVDPAAAAMVIPEGFYEKNGVLIPMGNDGRGVA